MLFKMFFLILYAAVILFMTECPLLKFDEKLAKKFNGGIWEVGGFIRTPTTKVVKNPVSKSYECLMGVWGETSAKTKHIIGNWIKCYPNPVVYSSHDEAQVKKICQNPKFKEHYTVYFPRKNSNFVFCWLNTKISGGEDVVQFNF